jgi:hypothetical protein
MFWGNLPTLGDCCATTNTQNSPAQTQHKDILPEVSGYEATTYLLPHCIKTERACTIRAHVSVESNQLVVFEPGHGIRDTHRPCLDRESQSERVSTLAHESVHVRSMGRVVQEPNIRREQSRQQDQGVGRVMPASSTPSRARQLPLPSSRWGQKYGPSAIALQRAPSSPESGALQRSNESPAGRRG